MVNLYQISRNAKELLVIPGLTLHEEQFFLYLPRFAATPFSRNGGTGIG